MAPFLTHMTLLSVRNEILSVLAQQETITLADLDHVVVGKELIAHREAILRTVLADLVEAGLLRKLESDKDAVLDIWVLTAPLGSGGQEIQISLTTATAIADEINAYIDAFPEREWPTADALGIHEGNLLMLLGIITDLRGEDPDGERFDPSNG